MNDKINVLSCLDDDVAGFWYPCSILFEMNLSFIQRTLLILLKQIDYSKTKEEIVLFLSAILDLSQEEVIKTLDYMVAIKSLELDNECLFPYKSTLKLTIGRKV